MTSSFTMGTLATLYGSTSTEILAPGKAKSFIKYFLTLLKNYILNL